MARTTPAVDADHRSADRRAAGPTLRRRALGAISALAVALVGVGLAAAAPAAVAATEQPTVTSDALPTVQVDGVVWAQTVVGNTVYVAGSFAKARPAGSPAGSVNETPRGNLLAYDIRTGELLSSWAPSLNGPAYAITASPDGSLIYVGGEFTSVRPAGSTTSVGRTRIASFNATTGALDSRVRPTPNGTVRAIVATSSTVYLGGNFTSVGGVTRPRVAAVTASAGALTSFYASVQSAQVEALLLTPDRSKLVIAGRFEKISNVPALGSGWVNATTGAVVPFPANQRVQNAGYSAGITSLSLAGDLIIGSGFQRLDNNDGSVGNLEGLFAASASTGELVWVQSCRGDTYSTYPASDGHIYLAGHPHDCSGSGGFPEPGSFAERVHHYALAFTQDARGTNGHNSVNGVWAGTPSPALANWFPTFAHGAITGQEQAVWSVTGNADYVVYGGEFPRVNGVAQSGLVRFAKRGIAPGNRGPALSGTAITPSVVSRAAGTAQVSWPVNHDPDDGTLTYRVHRSVGTSTSSTTVATLTHESRFWDRGRLSWSDTGLTPGATYSYAVSVTDSAGRSVTSSKVSVTVATTDPLSVYARTVLADAPANYWRLGETPPTVHTWTGANPGSAAGATGTPGGITGDDDRALRFAGTASSAAASGTAEAATNAVSVEAWFSTTSRTGGKIIGLGNARTGASTAFDRQIVMRDDGRLSFGVNPRVQKVVTSPSAYNDGRWHHVVATLGAGGMHLYVDGALVASDTAVSTGMQPFTGFWRIGGDSLAGWASGATSEYFAGAIDEVATYHRALSGTDVARHHAYGATGQAPKFAPTASFTAASDRLSVALDARASSDSDGTVTDYAWDFGDGTTGTGPTASRTYAQAGTYRVTLTVTDDDGLTATTAKDVTVITGTPTAAFTSTSAGLVLSVDGSTSTDPDGTLTYAWDFGGGATATGVTATHTFPAAGTYPVTLTVTDDHGQRSTTTRSVTVSTTLGRDTFTRSLTSGWGTADTGGTWTSSASGTSVTGGAGVLTLAQASSAASARLGGASGTDATTQVTVALDKVPNGAGVYGLVRARIADSTDAYRLKLQYQSNGQIKAWWTKSVGGTETAISSYNTVPGVTFGPGTKVVHKTVVTGTSPTRLQSKVWLEGQAEPAAWLHDFTDSSASLQVPGHVGVWNQLSSTTTNGPVAVRYDDLLVTGAGGATAPAPQAPTASFTSATSDLTARVDGSGSSDPDGTITSYAWTWGDGTTGSGVTASRTYTAAGSYPVTLTVTDSSGQTASVTRTVTVTAPATEPAPQPGPTVLGQDAFGRTLSSGWGTADVGGGYVWSSTGTSVSGGAGLFTLAQASSAASVRLPGAAGTDVTARVTMALDKVPNGSGVYSLVRVRIADSGDAYRLKMQHGSDGRVKVWWTKSVAGAETVISTYNTAPVTYGAGTVLVVKASATGTSPTRLRSRVWVQGTTEPTAWLHDFTDASASLQTSGQVGLWAQLSSSSTNGPVVVRYDDLVVSAG